MEQIEKNAYLNILFSFYGNLLTDKQRSYFEMYYFEDLSLQEIADELNVSRNAVHDQLKNVEKHLLEFESKLNLYKQYQKRQEIIKKIEETKDLTYLEELRKLDEL
ncbi:YlxM family DNA-binding protein [Acholeplasma equifetale]|uniref:YlxM family DNA-binding protein n=1 Tax=Acholeplasma equifetale TaxID=264634 RepID=UPI00138AEF07|nr:YlxM family DNA-binding protein [Acholeplasma equifetale]